MRAATTLPTGSVKDGVCAVIRRSISICALAGALTLLPLAAQAAPRNDDIYSATRISTPTFSADIDTTTATTAYNDPYCFGNSATVWWVYTAARSGAVEADTIGSNYDTTLSVYTGYPGSLTQIACDDDSSGLQSVVNFSVQAGTTYYIMAARYGENRTGGALSFQFQVQSTEPSWHDWVSQGGSLLNYPDCQYRGSTLHCFARSSAGTFLWWSGDPRYSMNRVDLGGSIGGPPSCVVRSTRIDCFAINSNARLVQITYNGSNWGSWVTVGGAVFDRPACVPIGTAGVDCYVTGTDKGLYRFSFNGFWAPITRVGTQTTPSRPECVVRGTGTDCFVVDSNGNVKTVRIASSGSFSSFKQIGTNFTYAPQCLNNNGKLDCFGRSKDRQFVKGFFNGSSWESWSKLGGSLETQPTCLRRSSTTNPDFDCYWGNSSSNLVVRQRIGKSWQPELNLGGSVKARPSCVYLSDRTDCFMTGSDGALKQKSYY